MTERNPLQSTENLPPKDPGTTKNPYGPDFPKGGPDNRWTLQDFDIGTDHCEIIGAKRLK